MEKKRIVTYVSPIIETMLTELAEKESRSVSNLTEKIITVYLTPSKHEQMDKNDVKKLLYREKPIANKISELSGTDVWIYRAQTSVGGFNFKVPVCEMGEMLFEDNEQSQLLIRWLL